MSSSRGNLCVAAGLGLLALAAAFPGRGGWGGAPAAAALWCPKGTLTAGRLEPVLERIVKDGPRAWGDSGVPKNTPPPWLDRRRAAAGRAFALRFPVSIVFGHVHALYFVLAVQPILDVLVYTGNSDTPDKAFIRYLDTVKGVSSWYFEDMFMPGTFAYEQLEHVRSLHALVRGDMTDGHQEAVRNRTRLGGDFSGCPVSAGLRRDLGRHQASAACPGRGRQSDGIQNSGPPTAVWMSQYDMSMTQWSFVGPIIQFPERYGIANATREELDGFVYLWRVIGYALGIEDRFNFCQGGLEPTLRRSREVLSTIVMPSLRRAAPPWEYMARCMSDGLGYLIPGIGFKTQLAALLSVTLDSPAPTLEALMSEQQRQGVAGYRGIMQALLRDRNGPLWAPARAYFEPLINILTRRVSAEDVKRVRHRPPHRARNCSPELRP